MKNRLFKCNNCQQEILEIYKNNKTLLNHIAEVKIFRISKKGNKVFSHFEKNKCELGNYINNSFKIKTSFTLIQEINKINNKISKKEENIKLISEFFEKNNIDFYKSKTTNSFYVEIEKKEEIKTLKISDHIIINIINNINKFNLKVNLNNELNLIENGKDYNFSENVGSNFYGNQKVHSAVDFALLINFNKKINLEKIKEIIKNIL